MDPNTLSLCVYLAAGLIVAAIGLLARDLFWGGRPRDESQPKLGRLPLAHETSKPRSFLGQIDHGFQRLINGAGLPMSPEAAFLLMTFVGVAVGGASFVWKDDLLIGVAGGAVGMLATLGVYIMLRARRMQAIREQLPDVIDTLSRAVRAGESLDQAIGLVAETAARPLAKEFRRCSGHLEMGLSLTSCLQSLHRRVPTPEVRILAAALIVQNQAGGSLPSTLDRLSRVVRDRLSFMRQLKASTAASRMGAVLIAAAGPMVAVYLFYWQREYLNKFWEVQHGMLLLGIAGALEAIGLAWVLGLLKSDY